MAEKRRRTKELSAEQESLLGDLRRQTEERHRKKKRHEKARLIFFLAAVVISMAVVLYPKKPVCPAEGELKVHFIDVGQGDCIYVAASGGNMLIDCGEKSETPKVIYYLKNMGVKRLDHVIATHPHSDHMGGMDMIISSFDIGEFIIPHLDDEDIPTASYFVHFLDAAEKYGVKLTEAAAGSEFAVGDAHCEIVAPNSRKYKEPNNYSVAVMLRHRSESFIFTGDAEGVSEREMIASGRIGKASVLKAGHHGSDTSTSEDFLRAVCPDAAVISCGAGNPYGHPNDITIERLSQYTDNIFRTDLCGTIVITSDGSGLSVTTERRSR